MKISGMTEADSLQNSDVLPIVRSSNNFKATLTTLASYVSDRISQLVGSGAITQLTPNDATEGPKVHVTYGNTPRYMTLNGILHYFHSNFFLTHIDMGSVSFNSGDPSSNAIQMFHNELKGTPQIIATVRSNTNGIYKINIASVNATGFNFTVKKYNGSSWDNTTDALTVQYIAIYRAWG